MSWRRSLEPNKIGKVVRNLLLSIIVLDSVFMSGTLGFESGLLIMLMLAPAMLLSKKYYVT
jgi:hypothetical protein